MDRYAHPLQRPRQAGFTLIELLVVLVLLALMLTTVPPLFSSAMPTIGLKGAARDLVGTLRQARGQAITGTGNGEVLLDLEAGEFRGGTSARVHRLPRGMNMQLERGERLDGDPPEPVLRFFADGSSNGGLITLGDEERRYRVEVHWLTGKVRIREPD